MICGGGCGSKNWLWNGDLTLMGGWKIKLIFLLMVYFAGFATAIYVFSPAPDELGQSYESGPDGAVFESGKFVQTFNLGLHRCVAFTKSAAITATEFLKKKIEQRRLATADT